MYVRHVRNHFSWSKTFSFWSRDHWVGHKRLIFISDLRFFTNSNFRTSFAKSNILNSIVLNYYLTLSSTGGTSSAWMFDFFRKMGHCCASLAKYLLCLANFVFFVVRANKKEWLWFTILCDRSWSIDNSALKVGGLVLTVGVWVAADKASFVQMTQVLTLI